MDDVTENAPEEDLSQLSNLVAEVVFVILEHLSVWDLMFLERTSRRFHALVLSHIRQRKDLDLERAFPSNKKGQREAARGVRRFLLTRCGTNLRTIKLEPRTAMDAFRDPRDMAKFAQECPRLTKLHEGSYPLDVDYVQATEHGLREVSARVTLYWPVELLVTLLRSCPGLETLRLDIHEMEDYIRLDDLVSAMTNCHDSLKVLEVHYANLSSDIMNSIVDMTVNCPHLVHVDLIAEPKGIVDEVEALRLKQLINGVSQIRSLTYKNVEDSSLLIHSVIEESLKKIEFHKV